MEDYPEEITGYSGDRVILQCQVDSNPPAEYVWTRNDDAFEVGSQEQLTLSKYFHTLELFSILTNYRLWARAPC